MVNILLCGLQGTRSNSHLLFFSSLLVGRKTNFLLPRFQRHVALKILKADASRHNKELSILLHLPDPGLEHPGHRHVVQLLDHFEHKGPNGTHLCLVFPMLISDGQVMTIRKKPRYANYVRTVSKQILLGLDFLHERAIIHSGIVLQ